MPVTVFATPLTTVKCDKWADGQGPHLYRLVREKTCRGAVAESGQYLRAATWAAARCAPGGPGILAAPGLEGVMGWISQGELEDIVWAVHAYLSPVICQELCGSLDAYPEATRAEKRRACADAEMRWNATCQTMATEFASSFRGQPLEELFDMADDAKQRLLTVLRLQWADRYLIVCGDEWGW